MKSGGSASSHVKAADIRRRCIVPSLPSFAQWFWRLWVSTLAACERSRPRFFLASAGQSTYISSLDAIIGYRRSGLKLKGRQSIEGKDAWVLEVLEDKWTFDLCFDVESGLMVRFDTDTGEPNGVSKVLISDYRSVDHVQFSFAAEMSTNKVIWRRKLTDVKFNVPVDDVLFRKT